MLYRVLQFNWSMDKQYLCVKFYIITYNFCNFAKIIQNIKIG